MLLSIYYTRSATEPYHYSLSIMAMVVIHVVYSYRKLKPYSGGYLGVKIVIS